MHQLLQLDTKQYQNFNIDLVWQAEPTVTLNFERTNRAMEICKCYGYIHWLFWRKQMNEEYNNLSECTKQLFALFEQHLSIGIKELLYLLYSPSLGPHISPKPLKYLTNSSYFITKYTISILFPLINTSYHTETPHISI